MATEKEVKTVEKRDRYDFTVYCDDRELREKLEKHAKDGTRSLSGQVLWICKEWVKMMENNEE